MNKFLIVGVLALVTVAHAVPTVTSFHNNVILADNSDKESRILALPTIGTLLFKGAKALLFLLKSGWAIIGLKVGIIALAANVVIWALKHSISIVIGAVGMFAFCKLTGKCTWSSVSQPLYDVGESLYYAARQFDAGINLYETMNSL